MLDVLASDREVDHNIALCPLLRIDREEEHLHVSKCRGDVCKKHNIVLRENLEHDLVERLALIRCVLVVRIPLGVHPAARELGVLSARDNVRTVALMNGDSVALRDKSDDSVSGKRVTALCKFDLAAVFSVND